MSLAARGRGSGVGWLRVTAFAVCLGLTISGSAQTPPVLLPTPEPRAPTPQLIDDFDSGTWAWSAHPSDGVDLRIEEDAGRRGKAMRLDFDFHGRAGYAIARRKIDIDLPANYELTWWMRAGAPVNNLELKLIDASGENVWWTNRRNFEFPRDWKEIVTRKRQISFAWGPAGGGEIRHVAALEIVVTTGSGGKGTLWIDDLALEPLPPDVTMPATFGSWHGGENEPYSIDFGHVQEIAGLRIGWDAENFASDFAVEVSRDGVSFERVRNVKNNRGGEELLWLPEIDARWLRLVPARTSRGGGWGFTSIEVEPASWAAAASDFFARVAERSRRGDYPRYLIGEQPYWTIAGADRAEEEVLVGEDGNIEPFKRGFSIEPFLRVDDRVISWADASISHSLDAGDLPIPTVTWTEEGAPGEARESRQDRARSRRAGSPPAGGQDARGPLSPLSPRERVARAPGERRVRGVRLAITAFVSDDNTLYIRYRASSERKTNATLYLAIRPFQVNPTTQFLNTPGGASPIRQIAYDGSAIIINSKEQVIPQTHPRRTGVLTFDEGSIVDAFRRGEPGVSIASAESPLRVTDEFGYASAALEYPLDLKPGESRDVTIAVPLRASASATPWSSALEQTRRSWRQKLDRVAVDIPAAPEVANTLRSNIAYILINRDGAGLQPGSRSYERSWIRDGALIASALLRLGDSSVAREFAEWFAPYQFGDGKVPCCVDSRGADPVPENDSHGEFISLVAEIWRYTHDEAFVRRMWPHVDAAAQYIAKLRSENHGAFEGLLTESISHEGYAAKPMHSYWDDFFGVRGIEDAAELAGVLKMNDRQRELQEQAASFRRDVAASIQRSIAEHHIDYVPGSAELGDFDATSTAIAVSPLDLASLLPPAALRATFDRYLREFRARRDGAMKWDVYTPYELRNVGAFVRLGRRAEANELLDFFMRDRRPAPWNEWAEVVPREVRSPHFLGDMPHSWVGSDFMRSLLDFFAYDREDGALVVGAGVPEKWVNGSSIHAGPLETYTGTINVRMSGEAHRVTVSLGGSARPRQIVVRSPYDRPVVRATVNGALTPVIAHEVKVTQLPARIVFDY